MDTEIPSNFQLLPGERLVQVVDFPTKPAPVEPLSALRELYRLAQAKTKSEVGTMGNVMAALPLDENETNPELRKYEAMFGRDSLRVASDVMALFPRLAYATLVTLAENQGVRYDVPREEEPGRIPHEIRADNDPIGKEITDTYGWRWPYYGSVDATPQFVHVLATYCKFSTEKTGFLFQKYTDRDGKEKQMVDALTAAVNWITHKLDTGEGFVEYQSVLPHGIKNQVWKDSWDAYFHSDGTMANHDAGIASVEVQQLAYDALLDAAELYENTLGRLDEAADLRKRATELRQKIVKELWIDEKGGYFAIGTDRSLIGVRQPMKIRTSNMGHVLHSQLFTDGSEMSREIVESTVRQIFSSVLLAASGIRTLASDEVRFRPGAYHNGSVWLWDTHVIARGLRMHGLHALADDLDERLFDVIDRLHGYPEFVRGDTEGISANTRIIDVYDEVNHHANRVEQPPQEIQAWSVAAIVAIKHYRGMSHHKSRPVQPIEQEILANI